MRPVTVVTGGTRGIGAATAVRLARQGHDLVIGHRGGVDDARSAVEAVQAAGARVAVVSGDVADPATAHRLFEAARALGPVTGLVASAGLTAHLGDLADTPVDVVTAVVGANLLGAIWCARRAAQVMSTARGGAGGAVVLVSSAAATLGAPHEHVHDAAAKAGVEALAKGLAVEIAAEGVRVNAVAPGLVETGIHADAGDPGRLRRVVTRVPLGRVAQPDEVAAAIVWLLGGEAGYATGSVLRVAGGL